MHYSRFRTYKLLILLLFLVLASVCAVKYYVLPDAEVLGKPSLHLDLSIMDKAAESIAERALGYPLMVRRPFSGHDLYSGALGERLAQATKELQGNLDTGRMLLAELYDVYPDRILVANNYAVALAWSGDWDAAANILLPFAGQDAGNASVTGIVAHNAGVMAFHAGRYGEALGPLRHAIGMMNRYDRDELEALGSSLTSLEAYMALCECYLALGKEPVEFPDTNVVGESRVSRYLRAVYAANQENGLGAAAGNLNAHQKDFGTSPIYFTTLSMMALKLGDQDQAWEFIQMAWDKARDRRPESLDHQLALDRYLLMLWLRGQQEKALDLVEEEGVPSRIVSGGRFHAFADLLRIVQAVSPMKTSAFGDSDRAMARLSVPPRGAMRDLWNALYKDISDKTLAEYESKLNWQVWFAGDQAIEQARANIDKQAPDRSREPLMEIIERTQGSVFKRVFAAVVGNLWMGFPVLAVLYVLLVYRFISSRLRMRRTNMTNPFTDEKVVEKVKEYLDTGIARVKAQPDQPVRKGDKGDKVDKAEEGEQSSGQEA